VQSLIVLRYLGCLLLVAIVVLGFASIKWAYGQYPEIMQRLVQIIVIGLAGGTVWVVFVIVFEYWQPWHRGRHSKRRYSQRPK
jgi:hypothetical protein